MVMGFDLLYVVLTVVAVLVAASPHLVILALYVHTRAADENRP